MLNLIGTSQQEVLKSWTINHLSTVSTTLFKSSFTASTPKSSSNTDLQASIDYNYRPNATVGSGSTADAVRYELETGQAVGGVSGHSQKASEQITVLQNWIKTRQMRLNLIFVLLRT